MSKRESVAYRAPFPRMWNGVRRADDESRRQTLRADTPEREAARSQKNFMTMQNTYIISMDAQLVKEFRKKARSAIDNHRGV